jgi:tetratricopeptide (TPR) repeat protein
MIEQALVYIYSANSARRFVGCGALVEGGYVATCRHVWRMATGVTKAEANGPQRVEVEYPRAREEGGAVRRPARLVDACEGATDPSPDLVLLLPDEIPVAGVTILRLASHERFQAGRGYAIAGLTRDEKKPNTPRDAKIPGTIADHEDADGRREFTGDNPNAYWFQPGSSGSPVFVDGGEQLAGIVSLSEKGANEGDSRLHEAFVVPGTTIRAHVVRLKAAPFARDQHISIADLQPVLDELGAQNVPMAEIPARIAAFVTAARAHAAERVPASNDGEDIDATIAASRQKLQVPDSAGARAVLQAKIDEERETRTRRLVPLLKERATVDRLAFDYESAKSALSEITVLTPDDVWAWLDLGDLWMVTGPLDCALGAYREAEGSARRADHERDLSVSYNRIGDVLVAQGNLPEAPKSFRDGLAIADRLAQSDPGNAGWQRDLSVPYEKIGDVLVDQGNLPEALKSFCDGLAIRDRLAQADPSNAGWQRDLSVSYEKIGDVLVDQGNLPEALKSFRDGLAIRDRLAPSDPGNAGWQRDLSVSYEKIGDVLVAQGNLPEALKSFRDGLAIADRLAQSDPGNAGWQRDLSVSYNKIGDVLVDQGNLPEALKTFRDGLAIRDRLAQTDPGNAGWQRDLSVSYNKIGDVLVAQGNLPEALKLFRDGLAIRDRLAQSDPSNAGWQFDLVASHWRLAANGDDAPRRFAFIVATLRKLKAENRLTPVQESWLPEAEAQLAKMR